MLLYLVRLALVCWYVVMPTYATYECVCSYSVETPVFPVPSSAAAPVGYMYEFDCKAAIHTPAEHGDFIAIQFEHQLGYVKKSSDLQNNTCDGSPSTDDLIPSTTRRVPGQTDMTTTPTPNSTPTPTSTTTPITATTPQITTTFRTTTTTVATTTTRSPIWQEANVTYPSLKYLGVGYNILSGNPDGNHGDSGYNLPRRVLQIPASLSDVQHEDRNSCSPTTNQSTLITSAKAYQQHLLDSIIITGISDGLRSRAFTANQEFKVAASLLDGDSATVYKYIRSSCQHGSAKFLLNGQGSIHITQDFARAACNLAQQSNLTDYFKFIDTWGTHIVTEINIGRQSLIRFKTGLRDLFNYVQIHTPQHLQQTGMSLTLDQSAWIRTSSASSYTWRYDALINQASQNELVPLHTVLLPISEALSAPYWQKVLPQLYIEGTCPDVVDAIVLENTRRRLAEAMDKYSDYKHSILGVTPSLLNSGAPPIAIPLTWPRGTYTLLKAASGCPAGHTNWETGSLYQDTEDHDANNQYSANIRQVLTGFFGSNNLETHFCTKTTSSSPTGTDLDWPPGVYCIMRKQGHCPTGFLEGSLFWDDEDDSNHNHHTGTLPDGSFVRDTLVNYCCRSDGSTQTPIHLPTDSPFVLYQYKSSCQQVSGMSLQLAHIRWDDEDDGNTDRRAGFYPLDTSGSHDHLLHMCYYSNSGGGGLPIIG